jgi:hypothetical protein
MIDTNYVPMLRWPDQESERRRLAELGEPRVLILDPTMSPPEPLDDLEHWAIDWSLMPATLASQPRLDEHGLLHHRGQWVAISDAQLGVVRLLVENLGGLVERERLRAAYLDAGGSPTTASFRSLIHRLRARFADVGLEMHVVRTKGIVLTPAEAPG